MAEEALALTRQAGELAGSMTGDEPGAALVRLIDGDAPEDRQVLAAASRRIDLGKPAFETDAGAGAEALLAVLLCRDALAGEPGLDALKRVNIALKAVDRAGDAALQDRAAPGGALDHHARECAARIPPVAARATELPPSRSARTAPITILFHEGPIARAYLALLAAEGVRPARIVELVSSVDLASGAPVGRWLPSGPRLAYCAWRQRQQIHHWPRLIARRHPALHRQIAAAASAALGIPQAVMDDAAGLGPLRDYADEVVRLPFRRLGDPELRALVQSLSPAVLLFTGGGLVPRALLDVSGARFIHVHPGHLPELRGADCAFWSTLVAGRLSASSFYMQPGIDTGDVIETEWLPPVDLGTLDPALPVKTVYRAIYSFLDPWLRAALLRALVRRHGRFDALATTSQAIDAGETFRFMHPMLQRIAFERLFKGLA